MKITIFAKLITQSFIRYIDFPSQNSIALDPTQVFGSPGKTK